MSIASVAVSRNRVVQFEDSKLSKKDKWSVMIDLQSLIMLDRPQVVLTL